MIQLPSPVITYPEIVNLLPQKPPMIMVDAYYGVINEEAYTSLYIKKDNILVEGEYFTELGILDFLAQSGILQMNEMSVHVDFLKEEKVGIITQFKQFFFYNTLKVGETIYGKVKKTFSNGYISNLEVTAFHENEILMQGIINVMIINNSVYVAQ